MMKKKTVCMIVMVAMIMFYGSAAAAQCLYFSANEMRGIVSKKLIKVGMSGSDLERSWGKPTKKLNNSRGAVWEYWNPQGDRIVDFDKGGCVKAWRTERA